MLVITLLGAFAGNSQAQVIKTSNFIFKTGDDVRLRTGGPSMTIESINGKIVQCNFLNRRYEFVSTDFMAEELEPIDIMLPEQFILESNNGMFTGLLTKLVLLKNSVE